jgi:hypothetical protein
MYEEKIHEGYNVWSTVDIRDPPIVNRTPLDSSRRDDSVGMISLATKSVLGFDKNSQKRRETDIWWRLYTGVDGRCIKLSFH